MSGVGDGDDQGKATGATVGGGGGYRSQQRDGSLLMQREGQGYSSKGIGRPFPGCRSDKLGLGMQVPGSLGETPWLGRCCLPGFTSSFPGTQTRNVEWPLLPASHSVLLIDSLPMPLPAPPGPWGVLQHTLCPSAWDTLPHVAGSLVGSLNTASVPLSLHPRELCMWNIAHPAPYFLHSAHHHLTHGTFISELVCLLQHNVHPMMARTMLLPVSSESSQMSSTWAWSCSTKTVWMSEWVSQLPNPICW